MSLMPTPNHAVPEHQAFPLSPLNDWLDTDVLDGLLGAESLGADVEALFADLLPLALTEIPLAIPEPLPQPPTHPDLCLTHIATTKALLYHLQAVVAEFVPSTPGVSPHPLTYLTQQLLNSVEATQLAIGAWDERPGS